MHIWKKKQQKKLGKKQKNGPKVNFELGLELGWGFFCIKKRIFAKSLTPRLSDL